MSDRTRQITVYVDPDLDREIEQRAADADVSKSQFVMEVVQTHIRDDLTRRVSQEAAVERRIEELVAHATNEVENAVESFRAESDLLAALLAETTKYSRANWALVKTDYGDKKRRKAIGTGIQTAERTAEDFGIDLDALGPGADSASGAGREATQGSASTPEDPDDEWYF